MEPKSLRFTKSHEWIAEDGTVGISDHAQKEITDVVFVDLPPIGKMALRGIEAGTIESVKAAFPIYAPVDGKVIAVNEAVANDPALVNQSPYDKGWLYKIQMTNPAEKNSLMSHDDYQNFLKTESANH